MKTFKQLLNESKFKRGDRVLVDLNGAKESGKIIYIKNNDVTVFIDRANKNYEVSIDDISKIK